MVLVYCCIGNENPSKLCVSVFLSALLSPRSEYWKSGTGAVRIVLPVVGDGSETNFIVSSRFVVPPTQSVRTEIDSPYVPREDFQVEPLIAPCIRSNERCLNVFDMALSSFYMATNPSERG